MSKSESETIEVNDFEQVVNDPAAFYTNPLAIVGDEGLSRAQRLRLLKEWAQDLVDRQVAADEGMGAETPRAEAAEATLLRQVNVAIETVEACPEAPPGLLTRAWRRLIEG
jgi:hypothetical protein